jgi:phosphoglucosamine mutase
MPTPAVAYLTRAFRAEAGIVISASHNPFYDNGIKFFSIEGTKLPDVEEAIEAEMEKELTCVDSAELGKASRIVDAAGRYIEFCKGTFPNELSLNAESGGRLRAWRDLSHCAECSASWVLRLSRWAVSRRAQHQRRGRATDVRALQARVLAKKPIWVLPTMAMAIASLWSTMKVTRSMATRFCISSPGKVCVRASCAAARWER